MIGAGWSVRVRAAQGRFVGSLRGQTFSVGPPVQFDSASREPSALEAFLASYGADLLGGFSRLAELARIPIDAAEIAVQGHLENPLVHVGVVGEEGSPRLAWLRATLFVHADAEPEALNEMWQTTLVRSPLHQTLIGCLPIEARLQTR